QGIQGLSANLGIVRGIAANSAGDLFISLPDYSAVVRLNTNGLLTLVAGIGTIGLSGDNGPATSAQLGYPNGLAVDAAGDLYISDADNNRVRKVSGGVITTVA